MNNEEQNYDFKNITLIKKNTRKIEIRKRKMESEKRKEIVMNV